MSQEETAKVTLLYVQKDITYIKLDLPDETAPLDHGLFELRMNSANYNAMYALALAASANRWPLTIRVLGGDVRAQGGVGIDYVTVNWAGTVG